MQMKKCNIQNYERSRLYNYCKREWLISLDACAVFVRLMVNAKLSLTYIAMTYLECVHPWLFLAVINQNSYLKFITRKKPKERSQTLHQPRRLMVPHVVVDVWHKWLTKIIGQNWLHTFFDEIMLLSPKSDMVPAIHKSNIHDTSYPTLFYRGWSWLSW